jgi:hypothetical protein
MPARKLLIALDLILVILAFGWLDQGGYWLGSR